MKQSSINRRIKTCSLILIALLFIILAAACNDKTVDVTPTVEAEEKDEIVEGKVYSDADLVDIHLSETNPYVVSGDYLYFGEYPQTVKAADVTIDENESRLITDSNDETMFTCYMGSDGYWYAKVVASTYQDTSYTFADGSTLTSGTSYYFRVLPLKWRILTKDYNKDGTPGDYLILSDRIVDTLPFQTKYQDGEFLVEGENIPPGTYANNYEYSEVRAWLNDQFYNGAFTDYQRQLISKTTISNAADTTAAKPGSTVYTSNDTQDYVFLLSYVDVLNEEYGFSTKNSYGDGERQLFTSDYSRAVGDDIWPMEGYFFGMGIWWMRTPCTNSMELVYRVSSHGYAYFYDNAYKDNGGIAAALVLNVD